MANIFELRDITKVYSRGREKIEIFYGLDFAVPEGDYVSLMGPSGSGKTTLLNLLGGIDRADGGTIEFRDQRIDTFSESQLSGWRASNIGFVFQFYNLMPMLDAAQNVELPLLLTKLGAKERKRRVASALEAVGLTARSGHRPNEMSGGQQQRVAIARALIADPPVLLCDEPTGDLDRKSAEEVLEILNFLNDDMGKTIVMVTHDPAAAGRARRLLKLDKGRFVATEKADA
ncbi:ABC transporter ATP-binding protein [Erythrobacter crassostreae]|uniref:ABC transporter ATP-binding protein n=1 Tax=Erythrobacter crassostreae TaxID=2828328 RepID=A0A9X1F4Y0_9SPHN|nr:ABC transporter ATP-binding protein [Erythrobacter crassostrea]MBV7260311.1 ABC transporter ATP-binding protein [Erythrobacter crassostrea]